MATGPALLGHMHLLTSVASSLICVSGGQTRLSVSLAVPTTWRGPEPGT